MRGVTFKSGRTLDEKLQHELDFADRLESRG
jgi:hypothetical protein